jgi:hypothetical protein
MPVISQIDPKSDHPIRRFIGTASNYRLQLAATPDTRDPQTGKILKGEHQVAQFKRSLFETNKPELIQRIEANKPELIQRIEDAYDYGTSIRDYDDLLAEGKERKYNDLLAMAKEDPELLERLKKDIVKKATVAQKKRAGKIRESIAAEASSN